MLGVEVRQLLAHDDQHQPEVPGAAGEVVRVGAGLRPADQMPRLVDQHHRPPQEQRRPRLRCVCAVRVPVPLDRAGDVLHQREHHEPQLRLRAAARVEHDQRRISGDGRLTVEEVGVGALPAILGQAVGEVSQRGGDIDRVLFLRLLRLGAQLLLEHRFPRRLARECGGLGVDGADSGAEQPLLARVQAAHHHLVKREQERDLLPRNLRRIRHVPRVQRVRRVVGADLDLLRPVEQSGEHLVVASAVDHERARPQRQAPRQQHRGGHRLATPAPAADHDRVVGVLLVVGVDELDGAAGVGERERHPGRRPAPGADQREHVAGVGGGVLPRPAVQVAAQGQARAPQLVLAELPAAHLAVPRRLDGLRAEIHSL